MGAEGTAEKWGQKDASLKEAWRQVWLDGSAPAVGDSGRQSRRPGWVDAEFHFIFWEIVTGPPGQRLSK
jgi:hypothetical protein